MRHDRTNVKWQAQLVRRTAGLIAFVFAFVSVAAFQHHHGSRDLSFVGTSVAQSLGGGLSLAAAEAVTDSDSSQHSQASLSPADCASCDWLATGITTPGTVTTTIAVTFSAIVLLLLQVRFAALCAAPAPRRGFRAPPLAFA